jgi:hypothetical protein
MLMLYTTPMMYLYFDRLQHWWSERASEPRVEEGFAQR